MKDNKNSSSQGVRKLLVKVVPSPVQNATSTFLQCFEYTLMLDRVSAIFLMKRASSFLHLSLLATYTHLRKPCLALRKFKYKA
ncbi:hypothetical protein J6590_069568 [Homalodisca vitripennis]|nr:hypothetical protein J6590_069568 [Homalodisca vitripennis]